MKISVQSKDFDQAAETALLEKNSPETGAIASFLGQVRPYGSKQGVPLKALYLEHYQAMTEKALTGLAEIACQRFRITGLTLIHRVGFLPAGARIVLILAASAHRKDALQAVEFLIDRLKTEAPFWKKEIFSDGSEAWVLQKEADRQASLAWQNRS